jgi:hypothetical protein
VKVRDWVRAAMVTVFLGMTLRIRERLVFVPRMPTGHENGFPWGPFPVSLSVGRTGWYRSHTPTPTRIEKKS